jgi:hypothetical protein
MKSIPSINGINMMKGKKENMSSISSSTPSANLPTAEINDDKVNNETFPVVHWNVSNVTDATDAYTNTAVAGNPHPVYSSRTRSRYTKARLHNISYGKTAHTKTKKANWNKNKLAVTHSANGKSKSAVKKSNQYSAAHTKKGTQRLSRN